MNKINLNNPKVPTREERLGSIIGYHGTAGDLVQRSRKGKIDDRHRSFTQASSCASSCAICLLSLIQDAAVVNHAPIGCASDFSMFNMVNRSGQFKRKIKMANARIVSSNLAEKEAVFGGASKLAQSIRETKERFNPKAIFVTASCTSAITGEDIDGVADEMESELGIPVVAVHCEGFRSQVWATGFDAAYHALLHKIVKPPKESHPEIINVVTFWGDDVFSELFNKIGLYPRLLVPFSTIGDIEKASEAGATVQICSTLGTYFAAGLEKEYGVPEVIAPPPFGIAGTDAWLREIGKVTGKSREVEELILSEKEAIAPQLEDLRRQLKGVTGYVAAGSVHGHSIACVMRELGMNVLGGCFWHHDPKFDNGDDRADSLQHMVTHHGDIPVGICNKQSFELVNLLRKLRPDIFIVRHPGMAVWGGKLGIPTFLVEDEHYGLGYRGLLRYGQKIADAINNPSFFQHLAEHTELPYTKWWLEQPAFSFIGENK